ncbi:hypothetical protein BDC45DRAFT_596290 [Circinella umbellata]|nr:hypothetical protein BDC45DRAFT_596290 [Circinella umbellata]
MASSSIVSSDHHDNIYFLHKSTNNKKQQQQQQQFRHQPLPPSPPKPPSTVNARDNRHSESRKPQLHEIPEESQQPIKSENESIHQTTQYILDEIKNLAQDILESEARADNYKRLYSETLNKLDAVRNEYESIFQELKVQLEQERIKVQYYQDLIRQQSQEKYSSSSSCYPSLSSSSTIASSSSSTKKGSKKSQNAHSTYPCNLLYIIFLIVIGMVTKEKVYEYP